VVNLICEKFRSDLLCFGRVCIRFWSGRLSVLVRNSGSVLRWLKSRAHGISTGALPEPMHWCRASLLEAALILFFAARQHSCLDFLRSVFVSGLLAFGLRSRGAPAPSASSAQ
jgi:hypothetical protein